MSKSLARSMQIGALLLALQAVTLAAQTTCDLDTWFDLANTDAQCSLTGTDAIVDISLPFESTYLSAAGDPRGDRMKALMDNRGRFALRVTPIADDLAVSTHDVLGPSAVHVTALNLVASIDLGESGVTAQSKSLVIPANTLYCGDELVADDVLVPLRMKNEDGDIQEISSCGAGQADEASRPWDWSVEMAPVEDDAEEDAGVAIDFSFKRTWGSGFKIDPTARAWSSNLVRVDLTGSGVTNDSDFHDAVKLDLSWAKNKNFVGRGIDNKVFTATWLGAYFRPETNFDDDHRDYAYGLRAEAILNVKKLFGTNFGSGVRPYVAIAFELVDPEKREDGTVPDNYDRLAAELRWKFYPQNAVMVEVNGEAKYILDENDLVALGLDEQLQKRLDVTVSLKLSAGEQFQPFIKITRGESSPTFEFADELLVGFAWNYLFDGEKALFPESSS